MGAHVLYLMSVGGTYLRHREGSIFSVIFDGHILDDMGGRRSEQEFGWIGYAIGNINFALFITYNHEICNVGTGAGEEYI